jgi:predicted aconitase
MVWFKNKYPAVPLFHMAKVTPEAMGDYTIEKMLRSCEGRRVEVTEEQLCKAYETLDSGDDGGGEVSLVALGNPHLRYVQMIILSLPVVELV